MVSREDEVKNRFRYLDILISAIVDHEKNLNDLILKLEKTVEKLSEIAEKIRKAEKLKGEA